MSRRKNMLKLDGSLGKVRRQYRGYAAAEEQKRKIVLYAGAALVGALMVLMAVWGIGTVVAEIIAPDKVTATAPVVESQMTEADAMVVLILKLNDENTAVENMVLTRFDPSDSRVYVAGLSPRVVYNGTTLGDYYLDGGTQSVADAVAGLVDCDKVYTVSVDYTSMRKVINIFGGATLTVPYAIKYDSPNNDRNLNVAPGTREYTGWEIARLLNYPDWNGGEQEQLYMYAMVTGRIISEHLFFDDSVKLRNILNQVYDEAESDIPMADFHQKTNGLLYLCSVNSRLPEETDLAVVVDVWPDEMGDGTLEYSEDNHFILCAAFGRRAPAED